FSEQRLDEVRASHVVSEIAEQVAAERIIAEILDDAAAVRVSAGLGDLILGRAGETLHERRTNRVFPECVDRSLAGEQEIRARRSGLRREPRSRGGDADRRVPVPLNECRDDRGCRVNTMY